MSESIKWEDFEKVDIRVGTILEVLDFPEAHKPAYKLKIDFGESLGVKQSSAQITSHLPSELVGEQVVAVVNFPPKQVGPFMSEVLTLGLANEEGRWIVVGPHKKVPNGERLQ